MGLLRNPDSDSGFVNILLYKYLKNLKIISHISKTVFKN